MGDSMSGVAMVQGGHFLEQWIAELLMTACL